MTLQCTIKNNIKDKKTSCVVRENTKKTES